MTQGWSGATEFSCTPNETYKQDCNTCVCSSDGKAAACQQIACPPDASESTTTVESATTADDSATTLDEGTTTLDEGTTTEAILEINNHVCTPNEIKLEVRLEAFFNHHALIN
jgi:Pacifastin inhibitor (LCMII)